MNNSGTGLTEQAIKRRLDPRLVYRSPGYRQAYAEIVEGLRNRTGLIVLTGAAGSGKTMLSQLCARELAADAHFVTFTGVPSTFDAALGHICQSLGLDITGVEPVQLLPLLKNFLLEPAQQTKTTVVVIEGAHELPNYVLNKLLSLGKSGAAETTLLSIVLLGRPELDAQLQQLNLQQKVRIRCHLDYLHDGEVSAFVQHRVHATGYPDNTLFSPQAIQHIAAYSGGSPPLINTLCDAALSIAGGQDRQTVTAEIVDEAARHGSLKALTPAAASSADRERRAVTLKKVNRVEHNPNKTDQQPRRRGLWTGIAATLLFCAGGTTHFLMASVESKPLAATAEPVPSINAIMPVIAAESAAPTDGVVDRNPSSAETAVAVITPPAVAPARARPTTAPEIIDVAVLPVVAPSPARQTVALDERRETAGETDAAPDVSSAPLTALTSLKQSEAHHQSTMVFIELHGNGIHTFRTAP